MWISHCGKPVSVCDGSDSDCWLMECGYITCVGECVHGGCNPPPLSLVSLWLRAQAPRIPTPDTSFLVGCANETEPIVPAYCRLPRNTVVLVADLSIYIRPRVKGRSFHSAPCMGVVWRSHTHSRLTRGEGLVCFVS